MNTVQYRKELTDWKFAMDQNESGESFGWSARTFDDSSWKDVKSYTSWETYEDAMALIEAGANRLGTSAGIAIISGSSDGAQGGY